MAEGTAPIHADSGLPAVDAGRLAGNYLTLVAGELLSKLITLVCYTWLGRLLGASRYGSLEFVLAVMMFFIIAAELGLNVFGATEVASDRTRAPALLRRIVSLRLILSAVAFLALACFAWLIDKPVEIKQLLVFYGFSLMAWPFALQWFFQGHDRMEWVAAASLARHGTFAALVFAFFRPHSSLLLLGLFELISMSAVAALSLIVVRRRFRSPVPPGRPAYIGRWESLRRSVPIGLSQLTGILHWYFATVLLGLLSDGRSLGWFGASHRATVALHTFVWLYFVNLLPSISRAVARRSDELRPLLRNSIRVAAWSGLFVAVAMTVFSRQVLTLAYGPEFAPAGDLFAVLVWVVPIAMVGGHYAYTLIGANLQGWRLGSAAAGATFAVAAGLALIPGFGATGAAAALLLASAVDLALSGAFVRRKVGPITALAVLARPAAVTVASLVVYTFLARWNSLAAGTAAVLLFLLLLALWERAALGRLFSTLSAAEIPLIRRRSHP